jgi:hypothetical protein
MLPPRPFNPPSFPTCSLGAVVVARSASGTVNTGMSLGIMGRAANKGTVGLSVRYAGREGVREGISGGTKGERREGYHIGARLASGECGPRTRGGTYTDRSRSISTCLISWMTRKASIPHPSPPRLTPFLCSPCRYHDLSIACITAHFAADKHGHSCVTKRNQDAVQTLREVRPLGAREWIAEGNGRVCEGKQK